MPNQSHATLQGYLLVTLFQFLARTRLGKVLPEWRCIFGPAGRERVFVPDLTLVLGDRVPQGDARDTPYLRTAPDLIVEVLSPGQPTRQFVDKVLYCLLHGVRLIWIIDPVAEIVMVVRPGSDAITLGINDQLDGGEELPGFSLAVGELFAQLHGS